MANRFKHVAHFLWCVRGSGSAWINDTRHALESGHVWSYSEAQLPHYEFRGDWEMRYFTLDGPYSATMLESFGFSPEPREGGECPEHLFELLCQEVEDHQLAAERRAALIAYDLLSIASSWSTLHASKHDEAEILRDFIDQHAHEPSLSIDRICDHFEKHRSTVSRIFSAKFKISIGHYLQKLRLQRSCEFLMATNLSVAEIAQRCGYSDQNYFTRAFRNAMGRSPRQFRQGH